jgi:phytoene dehydrogenase-like protein
MYENWIPVKPIVHVMLGVNRDLSEEAHRLIIEMEEPVVIGERTHKWMAVTNHSFDKSMSPEGKSEIEIWFDTEYEYWEKLSNEEYKAEKNRIADHVLGQLEKRWPGLTSQVEVVDVPTPLTYRKYTGNWKGSPDGWYITLQNMNTIEPVKTIPGLEGLYMAGQWTSPFTGTIIAALTGRQVVQLICRKDDIKFTTVTAPKETELAEI